MIAVTYSGGTLIYEGQRGVSYLGGPVSNSIGPDGRRSAPAAGRKPPDPGIGICSQTLAGARSRARESDYIYRARGWVHPQAGGCRYTVKVRQEQTPFPEESPLCPGGYSGFTGLNRPYSPLPPGGYRAPLALKFSQKFSHTKKSCKALNPFQYMEDPSDET